MLHNRYDIVNTETETDGNEPPSEDEREVKKAIRKLKKALRKSLKKRVGSDSFDSSNRLRPEGYEI